MSKKIVMYDSPEAAQIKIVTGWVSRDGRFWGDDERMARYCGATHRQCENNPDHPIIGVHDYCDLCRAKMAVQAFEDLRATDVYNAIESLEDEIQSDIS